MPELLLELFSEEIPARMQARAAEDLARLVTEGLKAAGLSFGKVEKFVSPRRLGLAVADIPASRADVREERRGPRVGAPEQALQGFLKSAGLASIDRCEKREVKGVAYYFAVIEQTGGPAGLALTNIIAQAVGTFPWPKSMRWGNTDERWVRPLHSGLALFDGRRLDFSYGLISPKNTSKQHLKTLRESNLDFNKFTFGHRFLDPSKIEVSSYSDYKDKLRKAFVIVDPTERRDRIRQEARALAAQHDLTLKEDEGLLDEVTGLVEWPVPLLGRIDKESMALPTEVLVTSMRAHQKYFALETPERAMAPHFLVIANMVTKDGGAAIVAGNERVLRARLADARFFWEQDRKVRLADRVKALDSITWHAKLGTTGEKVKRIEALAVEIAKHIPGADEAKVRRAAQLSKADLTTDMVGEFPELQGVMGRYYALHDKEHKDVANAIAEHWGPVGPSDKCPTAPVSVAVALADKIDSLVCFFGINERPTGSRDPFGLRRSALGIIRLLTENNVRLNFLEALTNAAIIALKVFVQDDERESRVIEGIVRSSEQSVTTVEIQNLVSIATGRETPFAASDYRFPATRIAHQILNSSWMLFDFFGERLKFAFYEKGVRHDLIDAVFALGDEKDLVRLLARVEALGVFIESDDGKNLLVAYRRAANIVKIEIKKDKVESYGDPKAERYTLPEEKALAAALDAVATESGALLAKEDFAGAMRLLAGLRAPVDAFFLKVTVNAPEKELRANRLALLQHLAATMDKIADFSKIEG